MVPKEVVGATLTDYLIRLADSADGLTAAHPVPSRPLQVKMDRVAKQRQGQVALGPLSPAPLSDPTLVAECVACPVVAGRFRRTLPKISFAPGGIDAT